MKFKEQICLGFILYHPESSLIDRIKTSTDNGYFCYIFDNTPENAAVRTNFATNENVKYLTAGKNAGLGIGMSVINGQAYYDGFKALLFFDQDTVYGIETLDFISGFYEDHTDLYLTHSSVVFNAKNIASCTQKYCVKDILLSISSGSLFYLDALKIIGFHNTDFFVDCVDYELCLNSDNHGFKTMECSNTPGFDHISEQADKPYEVFGKTLMLRAYPKNRVKGTVSAGARLVFMAASKLNIKYTYALGRSLLIYIFFQILVRILNLFK